MKVPTSDGIELFVEKSGNGFPCIYLHGGPGYWSKSFKHFSGEHLEENLEMIYLDQRGCGRSAHDIRSNYSLSRLVEDIEEIRKQLGIEEWFVMGHSFGGILAVNYAYYYSARTKGLILCNATLNLFDSLCHQIMKGAEILKEEVDISMNDHSSFIKTFYSILGKLISKGEYFPLQFKNLQSKERLDKLDKNLNSDPAFQEYVFLSKEYFQDFTLLSDKINLPVLVISGVADNAVGPNHHKSFTFKNMNVCEFDGGHHPYIENQSEFHNSILAFIEKNS